MPRFTVLVALAAIAATPVLAGVQTTPPVGGQSAPKSAAPDPYAPTDPVEREAWLRARGETYHRAPDSSQTPEELERTAALNAEIAARNDQAEADDRAAAAEYQAAQAKHHAAASAAATAQAQYEADLRASQNAQAQYERDQAAWRRRVEACNAGDRAACAPY
ncbi:MAG TPA: cell wall hydrolase [Brevundimonas sp.]|uniref:cell wall hydrolase n=1 Tax=Brevundimonas sp. TaxID=1871086 RepID=UPI00262901A7|nr:cell wall hydrolase [Brevundimonas sp.]HRO34414.1 cell wall hydrolase [Brevundimonas sp.]